MLRGFALGGVVLANLASFPAFVMPATVVESLTNTTADKIADFIMTVFIDHKFITLFSLLFGYGFGVIMERLSSKGVNQTLFFTRRMALLFFAGIVHLLFWWGEILHTYAYAGFVMLVFRNVSNRTLLIAGGVFLFVPTVIVRYYQITHHVLQPPQTDIIFQQYLDLSLARTWRAVIQANTLNHDYIYLQCYYEVADFFEIVGKFLLGYLVLRMGYLKNIAGNIAQIERFLKWSSVFAFLYIAELSLFFLLEIKIEFIALRLVLFVFNRFGVLMLSASYAAILVLLYHRWPRARIFSAIRYIGMMSLSNYLTHTVFYVLLLHGVGLGLMGKIHVMPIMLIGAGIYIFQAFISKYWLLKFQYGPAEWIWRQLSYWKRFPIRKESVA